MRSVGPIRSYVLACSFVLLALASACAVPPPTTNMETDIILNHDGSAVVVEHIELSLASGPFEREIRTQFPGAVASRRLLIDIADVADGESGEPIGYYAIQSAHSLLIRVRRSQTRSLRIMYGVRNAVNFGGDHDEFFWIANNVDAPTEAANITLALPPGVKDQFRAQAFLRSYDGRASRLALWSSSGVLPLQVQGNVIRAGAPGPLASGVAMVLDVFIPSGILHRPGLLTRSEWFVRANPIVLLPFGALLVMLVLRRVKPTAGSGQTIVTAFEPPQGLTPAEVGVLVDDHLDPRDVTATLIDLAVRGFVRLRETKPEEGLFTDSPDYIVELARPREEWAGLAQHERTMLFHTFYGGQWTKLSSLRLRFPAIVPFFEADVLHALKQKGMYRVDPETAQAWRVAALGAVAALLGFAQVLGIVSLSDSLTLSWLSIGVSMVIVLWLGRGLTPKTARGRKAWIAIRGFEEFIRKVEGDRLLRVQPAAFETYLPYAMALGIEQKWTRAFEGIAIARPEWMETSGNMLDSIAFGHKLDLMFQQAIMSAPRGRLSEPVANYFHESGRSASAG